MSSNYPPGVTGSEPEIIETTEDLYQEGYDGAMADIANRVDAQSADWIANALNHHAEDLSFQLNDKYGDYSDSDDDEKEEVQAMIDQLLAIEEDVRTGRLRVIRG